MHAGNPYLHCINSDLPADACLHWSQLLEFAEGGWRSKAPVARIKSPVSPSGRALGKLRM